MNHKSLKSGSLRKTRRFEVMFFGFQAQVQFPGSCFELGNRFVGGVRLQRTDLATQSEREALTHSHHMEGVPQAAHCACEDCARLFLGKYSTTVWFYKVSVMKNWSIWKPYNVWTARLVPFIWPFISWPSHVPRCRVGRIRKRLSASTTMRLYNGPAGMLILDGKAGHINTLKPPYRNFFGSLYLKVCGCIILHIYIYSIKRMTHHLQGRATFLLWHCFFVSYIVSYIH